MTEQELRQLLKDMSLEEKVFQMVQLPGQNFDTSAAVTGYADRQDQNDPLLSQAGSTLGIFGAAKLKAIQDTYMEKQPHHIPLLFMLDVIHGYETAFPCPLGLGATFAPKIAETCAQVSAREAAAGGIHVTFSPMADLARDARWGRVMESTGEDPYLNSQMAAAMVRGFQGEDVKEPGQVASCVKHFAAYGAAAAGLDYSNVELSRHTLREYYLGAYGAAVEAGCEMVMTSFNSWNGIPCTGNPWLMKDVLRREMGFDGVLISDWGAVGEMVNHGICEDLEQAAQKAAEAGVDIDMCADAYARHLAQLVRMGKVEERTIDDAVWRILVLKNKLGLFENPYKDADEIKEKECFLCQEHRRLAREAVRKSIVLLKNAGDDTRLLPLNREKKIAFIGPYVEGEDMRSSWVVTGSAEASVSIRQAAKEVLPAQNLLFAKGCTLLDNDTILNLDEFHMDGWEEENARLLKEAAETARQADVVVLCLGEHRRQSGEATSRTQIVLPKIQRKLLHTIAQVNDQVVSVIFSGRPLELREVSQYSRAVLEVWMPGTEGGHGIVDVLTGVYNPSGKLPMSFPYTVGQEPMSYSAYSTGRPKPEGMRGDYTTRYLDAPNEPLYPFGYGLSYTTFSISKPVLGSSSMTADGSITAAVTVKNTGDWEGTETLQLYLRDVTASCIRPVKELKGFCQVTLQPGKEQTVSFTVTEEMLRFHNPKEEYGSEPGLFRLWIGASSDCREYVEFELKPSGQ